MIFLFQVLNVLKELRISEQEFKPWFEHFESVLKHNVVPVGEEQTTTQKIQTPTTKVNYE